MKNEKKDIYLYLILAFGLPLICVFLVKTFNVLQSGILNFALYGIEAMTPTLASLIVTAYFSGTKKMQVFLKKCYFQNIKVYNIVLGIILPLTIFIITKLTSRIFISGSPFLTAITTKKLLIIMWALIAEELGWRGFLQDKLDQRYGPIVTPLILGIIWALWHYHFFLLGTMSVPLTLFTLGCITDSIALYFLTKKSQGNIIPASIWHFTENLCFSMFLIYPKYNKGSIVPYLIFTIYSAILAVSINIWGIPTLKKP